jgi:hypothetical protein
MNNHDYEKEMVNFLNFVFGASIPKMVVDIAEKQPKTFKEPALTIDQLLDIYNDYMTLHKLFGDQCYLEAAEGVMKKLRAH